MAPAQILAPYVTTERALYLVPGLFTQPAVAARLAAEPPEDRPIESLRRFTARCQLRLIERVEGVKLRWAHGGPFGAPEAAWAGEPQNCRVEER